MRINQKDARLNELWGQTDLIVYVIENTTVVRTVLCGEVTDSDGRIADTDGIVVLTSDGAHHAQTGGVFSQDVQYAVKFIKPASGRIGGEEVAIEAKQ